MESQASVVTAASASSQIPTNHNPAPPQRTTANASTQYSAPPAVSAGGAPPPSKMPTRKVDAAKLAAMQARVDLGISQVQASEQSGAGYKQKSF